MYKKSCIRLLPVLLWLWPHWVPAEGQPSPTTGAPTAAAPSAELPPEPFSFDVVTARARRLAADPFVENPDTLPAYLDQLNYDQFRDIRFNREKSLWREEGLPFQAQFFHRGFFHKNRVLMNVVDQGRATPLAYSPDFFNFGANRFPEPPPADLGFAGLRLLHPLRKDETFDEIAVFLGASYFRAIGLGQAYGLSARGVALDTGLPKAEEFPAFREFWLEKPVKGAGSITLYALLDGPRVTGAYRFVIKPGLDLVMEVNSRFFFRDRVERFGVAPLTSMFFHGENTDRFIDDFRPEVHDSDGLMIGRSNGEWLWRPLNNPRELKISVFSDKAPVGFGLLQRDQDFDSYQDLEAHYHRRPSAWVEPMGDWGQGAVYLVEIPSDAEKYDNIAAFWVPDRTTEKGQEWAFDYRLHFFLDEVFAPAGGKVVATRVGAGGSDVLDSSLRKFVVDFSSESLALLSDNAPVVAEMSASSGKVLNPVVHKSPETGNWRLAFELQPDAGSDPVELRAVLRQENEVLSETWLYQWSRR